MHFGKREDRAFVEKGMDRSSPQALSLPVHSASHLSTHTPMNQVTRFRGAGPAASKLNERTNERTNEPTSERRELTESGQLASLLCSSFTSIHSTEHRLLFPSFSLMGLNWVVLRRSRLSLLLSSSTPLLHHHHHHHSREIPFSCQEGLLVCATLPPAQILVGMAKRNNKCKRILGTQKMRGNFTHRSSTSTAIIRPSRFLLLSIIEIPNSTNHNQYHNSCSHQNLHHLRHRRIHSATT